MILFSIDALPTESSSQYSGVRFLELVDQNWDRSKSAQLAQSEGISLNDEHWAVIVFLRRYYLKHGVPRDARTLAELLNLQFSAQGGCEYLNRLFPSGPVTQGSRLANLRTPANAPDEAFGGSK